MTWSVKKSVVVPVDFSDESMSAVSAAIGLAESPAAVKVVHVLPDLAMTEPTEIWESIDYGLMRQRAEEALRERLDAAPTRGVESKVVFGDPGQAIVDFAKENKAELIVLPSHGRSGLQRLLVGSVAERVVRLSECPVLVLKTRKSG